MITEVSQIDRANGTERKRLLIDVAAAVVGLLLDIPFMEVLDGLKRGQEYTTAGFVYIPIKS